ncbi:hypothetical protein CNEO4_320119 [Clostridium neonatale]|nr:hypothetical protein CNEO4_320119 [Clostridium neonatale]
MLSTKLSTSIVSYVIICKTRAKTLKHFFKPYILYISITHFAINMSVLRRPLWIMYTLKI